MIAPILGLIDCANVIFFYVFCHGNIDLHGVKHGILVILWGDYIDLLVDLVLVFVLISVYVLAFGLSSLVFKLFALPLGDQ